MVSISYLWQASQLPLLEKMLACGMEVILVKVAGVGLGIDLVGKNLREVMPLLRRLVSSLLAFQLKYGLMKGITLWESPSR